jgi:hypothetical protein
MIDSSTYRQLVLFDCNDDRLSLFKDHKKYLSQIPSNSEWYIFWNEFKLPVYKKLKWILRNYSHIHLYPSYRRRMDDSPNSDLLIFLDEVISKFSFVLLVHGDNQSYRKVFERVTNQYGKGKMKLRTISKCFSQHLPRILIQLEKKYRHHRYLQNLSSKDQLQHKRRPFFSNNIWNYDIPYDQEEIITFKSLIKRKQKSLKIYFYNARICNITQFDDDEEYEQDIDNDEECEQDTDDYLLFSCWRCSHKFKCVDERLFHFIIQHAASLRSRAQELSTLVSNQIVAIQDNLESVNTGTNTIKKSISCWQCTKKYAFVESVLFHFVDKHANFILYSDTDPSSHLEEHLMTEQKRMQRCLPRQCSKISNNGPGLLGQNVDRRKTPVLPTSNIASMQENMSIPLSNSFICWYCGKKLKSDIGRLAHVACKHAGVSLTADTEPSRRLEKHQMTAQKRVKKKKYVSDPMNTFLCWYCPKICKTACDRLDHFFDNHTKSFLSTTPISSYYIGNCTSLMQENMNSAELMSIFSSNPFTCCYCGKNRKSNRYCLTHFVSKHVTFDDNIDTDTDPSNIFRKRIVIAEKWIYFTEYDDLFKGIIQLFATLE